MKKLVILGLALSITSASVFAQQPSGGPQPGVRRYKLVPDGQGGYNKEYIDPMHLPAAIADVVSGILFFGGSTVTSEGKEKYKIYGWIAMGAGLAMGALVQAIDGRSEIQVSSVDGKDILHLDTKKVLASIEADSLMISEGLGDIQVVSDLAASSKMSSQQLATLVLKSKDYANGLTQGQQIAVKRVSVDAKDVKASLNLQTNDQAAIVFNYLTLRNVQVRNI